MRKTLIGFVCLLLAGCSNVVGGFQYNLFPTGDGEVSMGKLTPFPMDANGNPVDQEEVTGP